MLLRRLLLAVAFLPACNACGKTRDTPTPTATPTPATPPGDLAPGTIAVGDLFACAVTPAQKVACWGENAMGQLGVSGASTHDQATEAPGLEAIAQVAASGRHACALGRNGQVHCWGENNRGQAGQAPSLGAKVADTVAIGPASHVATSAYESCAIAKGTLACWGDATRKHEPEHLFTWPDEAALVRPLLVTGMSDLVRVATGARHFCVLDTEGHVACRGDDEDGRVDGKPGGAPEDELRPVALHGLAREVGAGDVQSCALLRTGEVECWGDNERGELGDRKRSDGSVGRVPLKESATALSVGSDHACALLASGGVACWGWNHYLQTGAASADDHAVTIVAGLPADIVAIGCGGMLSCARTRSGAVHCWGATSADDMFGAAPEKKRVRRISGI